MKINFNDVDILRRRGIDYWSKNTPGLTNAKDTSFAKLVNTWAAYPGTSGADVVCQLVEVGKKKRLRIAVYHKQDTKKLWLFSVNSVEKAIDFMYKEAGQ